MRNPSPVELALDEIQHLVKVERDAKIRLQRTVDSAIASGAKWQEVADAAGITRQVAHTRWSTKGKAAKRAQNQRISAAARGQLDLDVPSKRGLRGFRWKRRN